MKTRPFRTMACPDCEGYGDNGYNTHDHNGSYRVKGQPCVRCNATSRVVAPEAVLLAILKELRKLNRALAPTDDRAAVATPTWWRCACGWVGGPDTDVCGWDRMRCQRTRAEGRAIEHPFKGGGGAVG